MWVHLERGGPGATKQRNYYWRYVIRIELIYQALSVAHFRQCWNGHFSLIPNQLNAPGIRGWGRYDNLIIIYFGNPAQPPPDRAGVHTTFISSAIPFVAYPLVAKKFELHDLLMKAAGLVKFDGRRRRG
jgi:hypothetical protein